MSGSAAPLGSLRSPRRAAERKSGHFTCYENRTFHLLPTPRLRERRLRSRMKCFGATTSSNYGRDSRPLC